MHEQLPLQATVPYQRGRFTAVRGREARPRSKLATGYRATRARFASIVVLAMAAASCRPARPPSEAGRKSGTASERQCQVTPATRGLDLVVLGSGGPRAAGRAASSYLFTVDGTPRIVVDVGPGMFARLGESGLPADRLDVVLLTHLHIDHSGDLPALVKSRDLSANEPLSFRVVGPSGREPYPSTSAFIERLFGKEGAYAYLPSFRNELAIQPHEVEFDIEAAPRTVLELDGVRISAVAVDHGDVPALAYRLDGRGRSCVVSGDLASKRGHITKLAQGADVLVYDAAVLDPPGSPESLYELHTPPARIGEVAAAAAVKTLILGHLPASVEADREEILASIRRSFAGDVRFATDCMHLGAEDQ